MLLSVVLPTYNEAGNIARMVGAVREAMAGLDHEVLVIDDNSKDGTAKLAREAGARVVVRTTERGLATAVVRGIAEAKGKYVAVMDADFQHPPATVRAMAERAVARDADLVIGSRYVEGGTEGDFSFVRKQISRGASVMAHLALPAVRRFHLTDPMSGLFLVRKDRVDVAQLQPKGYKVLLEVIAKGRLERVEEVGYTFGTRAAGDSKLGAKTILLYVAHLAALAWQDKENWRLAKFIAVGLSGVVVQLAAIFALTTWAGWDDSLAFFPGFELAVLNNFLWNNAFTFGDRHRLRLLPRLALFHAVSFSALVVQFAAFFLFDKLLGWNYALATLLAVVAGFGVNWTGNKRVTFSTGLPPARRWVPYLVLVVAASGLYFGGVGEIRDLVFDEHYYVSVAHQLENGILNDPCWANDAVLAERPLNYEHPPLAKLILWASVHAYDTYHGTFTGCRDPNNDRHEQCLVIEPGQPSGQPPRSFADGKQCYDAFTSDLKERGNAYAWRGPAALFGVLTVLGVAMAARRLFLSDVAGTLAGAFVLLDTLMVSAGRIALLDVFAAGFAALAVWAATHPTKKGVLMAALLLGLGFSCKYYVLFAGPPTLLLSLWMHHRAGKLTRRRFDLHVLAYLFVPLAAWLATYTPWWVLWIKEHGVSWAVSHFIAVQHEAFAWLASGKQDHQYLSQPIEWIALVHPIFYVGSATLLASGDWRSYLYGIGNPLLWWLASLAVLALVGWMVGGYVTALAARPQGLFRYIGGLPRRRQATFMAALFPLFVYGAFVLLAYVGSLQDKERSMFIFYMTIVAPFLSLALAGPVAWLFAVPTRLARGIAVGVCAAVVVGFLLYVPLALYIPIPRGYFHFLFKLVPWMHECGKDLLCA